VNGIAEFEYGPDIPGETELRLLGPVAGKRLLVLGCRRTDAILSLARNQAKVIVVDHVSQRVDRAREACEKADVRVEFHRTDLADLAFLRGDSIDAALSVSALAEVEDLNRVFRQVHRVLGANAPLALSLPHPAFAALDPEGGEPPRLARRYADAEPLTGRVEGVDAEYSHTIGGLFTSLTRAKFRVDTFLEPEPTSGVARSAHWAPAMAWMPATLVLRARKEGS
jgi:ubiquinone/menaquinone biosynthesis C-methylase UbiE